MASEIDKNRIDLAGVQEGTLESGKYTLIYGEFNANHLLAPGFFLHRRDRSAGKRVEFISDRVPCITLKHRFCDIINYWNAALKLRIPKALELINNISYKF